MSDKSKIRNFSIIAHIDHGKSTLADRLLEATSAVSSREVDEQMLDNMELEKERGITIKARAVRLDYKTASGEAYELNLIDTPGHVDFNYEVSRSLAACEGALLVVDASQGIEAQTLANTYLAIEHDLEIVPVINKIDLPAAEPERVASEIETVIGIPAMDAPKISAKTGLNIQAVLDKIVESVPAPKGDEKKPLKALIFDSYYDSYRGVIVYIRLMEGTIKKGDRVKLMATGSYFDVVEVGCMRPFGLEERPEGLSAGDVGYFTASIKDVNETAVGDTVTNADDPAEKPLPGYKKVNSMVFCGIYPQDGAKYDALRDALEKLKLNDAALNFEPETSTALGFGFRCGFLGLLHLDVIQERLEREFMLDLITTSPSVIYKVVMTDGSERLIYNPVDYPKDSILCAYEPFVKADIIVPTEYVGNIMELCQDRRGVFKNMTYIDTDRANLHYELPLNEIVYDFFDALKSRTRGYASFDYELSEYKESKLVKLDLLLNGDIVDAFSMIVHEEKAYARGRRIAEKLKESIPRQLFEIPIQAAIGGKIIARETVKAMRKDVLAKCYGGDITRKKKLLEKQKEGKKKMRQIGSVEVPKEAFLSVLKLD
ncbi:MAG: translation elongation factor 4 [Clostridia bacterium]|nr:translation elongation factor 4 [Clostridia bacterium]